MPHRRGLPFRVVRLAPRPGNALVQAIVTDGSEGVRQQVAARLGGGQPNALIERRMDKTRELLAAAAPDELAKVQEAQAGRCESRIADLFADHPDAAAEGSRACRGNGGSDAHLSHLGS